MSVVNSYIKAILIQHQRLKEAGWPPRKADAGGNTDLCSMRAWRNDSFIVELIHIYLMIIICDSLWEKGAFPTKIQVPRSAPARSQVSTRRQSPLSYLAPVKVR